ncbi:hypothetical protein PR048_011173 [Dryococelus australis]|uniref:arginine kinase n=1 Tax=Dryococelus australis TaxID=614101 RepID=A0ABQ9HL57_9NEOP|nr:hypothetical protein PR048_011173 [Dryococelus australis]
MCATFVLQCPVGAGLQAGPEDRKQQATTPMRFNSCWSVHQRCGLGVGGTGIRWHPIPKLQVCAMLPLYIDVTIVVLKVEAGFGEYIISTRVRCGRSMEGYPFNPCLTEAQYKEMEDKVSSTLSGLEGELKGKFYPLTGMDKATQQKLIDDHFLFKEGDRFLQIVLHVTTFRKACEMAAIVTVIWASMAIGMEFPAMHGKISYQVWKLDTSYVLGQVPYKLLYLAYHIAVSELGFLGDFPFRPPLHSGAASPSSALKTSFLRLAQISQLYSHRVARSIKLRTHSSYSGLHPGSCARPCRSLHKIKYGSRYLVISASVLLHAATEQRGSRPFIVPNWSVLIELLFEVSCAGIAGDSCAAGGRLVSRDGRRAITCMKYWYCLRAWSYIAAAKLGVPSKRQPMRVKQGENEAVPECKGGGNGRSPSISGIVWHDSHLPKSGSHPAGDLTRFALVGGEQANRSTTTAPSMIGIFTGFSRRVYLQYSVSLDRRMNKVMRPVAKSVLYKAEDYTKCIQAANACRFWPTGRGIYHNDAKTFLVWCNEEDHLRLISMQQGGDLGQISMVCVVARFWPALIELLRDGEGEVRNEAAPQYKVVGNWISRENPSSSGIVQQDSHLQNPRGTTWPGMERCWPWWEIYRRLVTAVNDIEKRIPFSHNDRLGFLTFCPSNLGTTVRASVHIKVPKLAANRQKLEEIASKFNLQVRGTRGEHTEAEGGVYDISNKRRMGLTEYEAVKEMNDGIAELIKIEASL